MRVALVTGGARGIGFAIARTLAQRGMAVAINDLHTEAAEKAAGELSAAGHQVIASPADVTVASQVTQMVETVERQLGPLWLLVNNAGTFHSAPVERMPEADWDRAFAVDAKGVFLCSQAAAKSMMTRREGRIIVISSIAGMIVRTGQVAYCSAKAAAIHFARCLAVEVAPHGISVNCICPGMTDTAMLRETAASRNLDVKNYLDMIPSGRFAQPEDHAQTVLWLASNEAGHVTGQVIAVDGGQSLFHPLTRAAL